MTNTTAPRPSLLALSLLAFMTSTTALATPATLSFDDAARAALARVPNGEVHSIERDTHFGRAVFEVEVHLPNGCEHEITVSATDASIVAEKVDCD